VALTVKPVPDAACFIKRASARVEVALAAAQRRLQDAARDDQVALGRWGFSAVWSGRAPLERARAQQGAMPNVGEMVAW
jgi:hypothetical protein